MYKKIAIEIIITFIAVAFASINVAVAFKNPSAIYCKEMGYELVIEKTEEGQKGVCKFSKTESCPAWDFLTGKCGASFSYCDREGYELKPANGYAVCILENGEEIEITKLMELNFEEGICGDGRCVLGESYEICPHDCPSGSFDRYCDGIKDDLCDPDCTFETDFDCAEKLIKVNVDICSDKECLQRNKIFIRSETVYFKINSSFTNLDISATIKTPIDEIKQLTFENNLANFKSDEIGSFSLWVTLSKNNYLNQKIEKTFAYIEKPVEIPSASICNQDGKCKGDENEQNCPQDCLGKKKINVGLIALAGGIVLGGLGIIAWRKMKRKKQKEAWR